MKITSSAISMASQRSYAKTEQSYEESVDLRSEVAATLEFSEEAKENYMVQLNDQLRGKEKDNKTLMEENQLNGLKDMLEHSRECSDEFEIPAFDEDPMIQTLKRILEMLKAMQKGERYVMSPLDFNARSAASGNCFKLSCEASNSLSLNVFSTLGAEVIHGNSSVWTKTTASVSYFGEVENTAFTSQGIAHTEDGREISFNIEIAMSRSFYETRQSITQSDYIVTDPLTFNVGKDVAEISDQKFYFDLNADGKEELISFATGNSGFLALDKNGNGKIDNGNELFGAKSGDGFKDLAAYDEDRNGWIDENDSVFNKLRIFKKDKDGKDVLLSLKDFNVGAIYLGNANTQFSLTDDKNNVEGVVRKTGIYLKENGGVGAVQHVDIAL